MGNMAAPAWTGVLLALLAVSTALDHSRDAEVYRVSAGHVFLLRCPGLHACSHVAWSRAGGAGAGGAGAGGLPTGVEVKDGLLWFTPVFIHHNGTYSCERRCQAGSTGMSFLLSVSSAECPDPSENRSITEATSEELPCKQEDIFSLESSRDVRWMKECHPVQQQQQDSERGGLRLLSASQRDAGKYTCLVDVTVEGKKYTAARSFQLTVQPVPAGPFQPQVVIPQNQVVIVQVGMRAEVKCIAYIGPKDDEEISMYWTVDGQYAEMHHELSESSKPVSNGRMVFKHSTLSISRVPRHFLEVPITCHIQNMLAHTEGVAWLREADHSVFHLTVSLCLLASIAVALVVVLFLFFKVDLVLAYRKVLTHFSKRQDPDGKLYDAYVSFLQPDCQSWHHETERFALHSLPAELEDQHGYSLFIPGRDDRPGEAMHDAVTTTVSQCRRLIIILSSWDKKEESSALYEQRSQLCYEQKVGLYDALTKNGPRVILLETGGPVDYSRLPESLGYIKRKHGALKWNHTYARCGKLSRRRTERNFWKNLRYHMPPVPVRSHQTV